jgi:secreted trypsin-like serine protease
MLVKIAATAATSGLVAAFALGCSAASGELPAPEETADSSRHDIVGGAATKAFPAAGALTRNGYAHCTGTLVAPRKVLTAAHCLVGVSASELRFVIGPTISSPEAIVAVASVTPHPSYDDYKLSDDIGYATLTKDAPVAPMKIIPALDGSWVGKPLVFVGYGMTSGYGGGSGAKRSVTIPIAQIGAKQFSYQTSGKNTCSGDSGGPAFAQVGNDYFVAGVTSYGDPGCSQYGVDTRADVYSTFLAISPSSGAQDPCSGESYEGRCNGNTVVWCENQNVYQSDCTNKQKACGFSAQKGYYECLADPCQGETYAGRCDGSTVVWCESEQIKSLSCKQCGFDGSKGYYNCL